MKKSIVLLISLFFISALSILILKNLSDTEQYINEQNHKLIKTQLLALVKNIQLEAKKNSENLSKVIDKTIPFEVEKGINIVFTLNNYERTNINVLKDMEKLFNENNISDYDSFKYIYNNKKTEYKIDKDNQLVYNSKHVDDIIDTFIKETFNNNILDIKDKIGFFSKEDDKQWYELYIKVDYLKSVANAYYILDDKGEEKYFELSFK